MNTAGLWQESGSGGKGAGRRAVPELAEWLLTLAMLAAGLAGLRLTQDIDLWDRIFGDSRASFRVGTLYRQEGGVRKKNDGAYLWRDVVSASQPVSNGDAVFTSEDGRARILFEDDSAIELAPGSLIVVRASSQASGSGWLNGLLRPAAPAVTVRSGSVKLNLPAPGSELDVQLGEKTVRLTSRARQATVVLTAEGKAGSGGAEALRLSASTPGAIAIQDAAKPSAEPMTLKESEAVRLEEGATSTMSAKFEEKLVTIAPEAMQVVAVKPSRPVEFSWKPVAARSRLEIEPLGPHSPGSSRPKVTRDIQPKSGSSLETLSGGKYRWRLTSLSGGESSAWVSFEVSVLSPPEVLSPADSATFELAEAAGRKEIVFSWQPLASGLGSELEVVSSADGKPVHLGSKGTAARAELPPGEYSWRARAISADLDLSAWTPPKKFSIRLASATATAAPDTAKPRQAETSKPVTGAPKSAPKVAKKLPTRIELLPTLEVEASTPASASVAQAKAVAKKPAVKNPDLQTDQADASTALRSEEDLDTINVALRWRGVPGIRQYEVSIFDRDRKPVRESKVSDPRLIFTLSSLETTQYFYQVAVELPGGEKVRSKLVPISITLSPPIPKEPPLDSSHQLGQSLLLTWQRTSLTQRYRLQIATDPAFKSPVLDQERVENLFTFRPESASRHYWRVMSISHGLKSAWSQVNRFEVSGAAAGAGKSASEGIE